ncbi:MAG: hypothetical protein WCF26_00395 [Candidatus Sulfotelmatobacter sp.]
MKFATGIRVAALLVASLLVAIVPAHGREKKEKAAGAKMVDSGSFGIFVRGQRVATETFSIQQQNGASSIKSQFKETSGNDTATQKSDLQITSSGELLHYEWSQSAGGSVTVAPNNDFLLERITPPAGKTAEQPFLMPSTSSILDNNFFVHREVLAWRYLAADCKSDPAGLKCEHTPGDFGVLVPQDRASVHVRLELVGKEKVMIRGNERELLRLNLTGDNFAWALWVDDHDQFKLMRVAIAADNTEVVRD